ncbi:hypothetical protein RJT34_11960 [Clitoria ternatea]|uniref:Transmembrane protein n=1 Tax=Clitoria ternatea TaxID=43366 RepID=A0AAN9PIX2_CLITE
MLELPETPEGEDSDAVCRGGRKGTEFCNEEDREQTNEKMDLRRLLYLMNQPKSPLPFPISVCCEWVSFRKEAVPFAACTVPVLLLSVLTGRYSLFNARRLPFACSLLTMLAACHVVKNGSSTMSFVCLCCLMSFLALCILDF